MVCVSKNMGITEINTNNTTVIEGNVVNMGNSSLAVECPCCQTEFIETKLQFHAQHLLFADCDSGNASLVSMLLLCSYKNGNDGNDVGINVNSLSDDGWSPLGIACYYGHIDVVNVLLDNPTVEVNGIARVVDKYVYAPLHVAVQQHQLTVIERLLHQSDLQFDKKVIYTPDKTSSRTINTVTAFDIAVHREDFEAVLLFIELTDVKLLVQLDDEDDVEVDGNNIYERSNNHHDPKYRRFANYETFFHSMICDGGTMIKNHPDDGEESAIRLIDAVFDRDDYDLDINQNFNLSFICRCVIYSYLKIADYVLHRLLSSLSTATKETTTMTPNTVYRLLYTLKISCFSNSQLSKLDDETGFITNAKNKLFDYVVDCYGVNINTLNHKGNSVLHMACSDTEYDVVEGLMRSIHLDVNLVNKQGKTALQLCVENSDYQGVGFLCSRSDLDTNVPVNVNNVLYHVRHYFDRLPNDRTSNYHPDMTEFEPHPNVIIDDDDDDDDNDDDDDDDDDDDEPIMSYSEV